MMSVVSIQEIEDYVDNKISGILIVNKNSTAESDTHHDPGSANTTVVEANPLNEPEKVHIHPHHIQFDLESTNSHQFLYEQLNSANNRSRINSSRLKRTPSDDHQPLYLTHITLSLNLLDNNSNRSAESSHNWKYNTVRKNPFPNAYFSRADAALRRNNRTPSRGNEKQFFMTSRNHLGASDFKNVSDTKPSSSASPTRPKPVENEMLNSSINLNDSIQSTPRIQPATSVANSTISTVTNNHSQPHHHQAQQQQQQHHHNNNHQASPSTFMYHHTSSISSSCPPDHQPSKQRLYSSNMNHSEASYRTKSSTAVSSISSIETQRSSGRHTFTVSDFNKFKSQLLKNHSRNYYYSNERYYYNQQSQHQRSSTANPPPSSASSAAPATKTITLKFNEHKPVIHRPTTGSANKSQIRSIYESVEGLSTSPSSRPRSNRPRWTRTEEKRVSYEQANEKRQTLLSSSLIIKKI